MKDSELMPVVSKNLSDYVAEALNDYIEKQLQEGNTKLPAEVELAQILSVSRTTIRRALSNLENRGVVFRIHGKGTFINPNFSQVKLNINSGLPLLELIDRSGFRASVRLLYHITSDASPMQQSVLHLNPNSPVITVCKVYYADSTPVILLIDNIPCKYLHGACTDEELAGSAFDLLRQRGGIICVRDDVTYYSSDSASLMAYTMGKQVMDCTSMLVTDIVSYSGNNEPIFTSKICYNTNCIKFHNMRTLDVYR